MSFVEDIFRAMEKLNQTINEVSNIQKKQDQAISELSNSQKKLVEVFETHMILDPTRSLPPIPKVNMTALDKELKKQ